MAVKKRLDIAAPERSLLTDTLPYEIPIFFTNANLAILALQSRLKKSTHKLHEKLLLSLSDGTKATKPFVFDIRRNNNGTRRLSLAHPISQHRISQFYGKYDHFISNSCNRSSISLRYPSRVATHYVDPRYAKNLNNNNNGEQPDEDPVGFRDQSRWASTYFSYRDYSLSHKFFESEEFLELERRFSFLMKLDVSRCFDSIYTHSIEWSMRGKDFSKTHLPTKSAMTFESSFDLAIRHGNWNETHGILVGPESSRIFAEVILQSADRAILNFPDIKNKSNVIRRYVDDYYVFSNSKEELTCIETAIRKSLQELNLHLNERKREIVTRPFVSKVSVARRKVSSAIDDFFKDTQLVALPDTNLVDPRDMERSRVLLISRLRQISVELSTPYEAFASLALTVLKNKLEEVHSSTLELKLVFKHGHLARLSWLTSVMRVGQFLYSTDRRATTSVKIAAIYSLLIQLAKNLSCARAPLEHQILDGLRDAAMCGLPEDTDEVTRINHICVVDLLLTDDRRINADDVKRYIGDVTIKNIAQSLSLFQLIAVLFLSRRRQRFSLQLKAAGEEIERRLRSKEFRPLSDTSHAILLTEFISCPYFDSSVKVKLIRHCHELILGSGCSNKEATDLVTRSSWISFTDWSSSSDLATMLARKELTPAYE